MNIILNIDSKRFSLNGIQYFKNYISNVAGNNLKIINAYDSNNVLLDWTNYTQISVDGVIYGSVALLQSNLIYVCFNRAVSIDPSEFLPSTLANYPNATLPIAETDDLLVNQNGDWRKANKNEIIPVIEDASPTQRGLVNTVNQTFEGIKKFKKEICILDGFYLALFKPDNAEFSEFKYTQNNELRITNPSGITIFNSFNGYIFNTFFKQNAIFLSPSGNVGIGTITPQGILDVSSTTQGSLPFPRMTQAQRNFLPLIVGTHIYQTDGTEGVYVYKSTGWQFAY